MTNLKKSTMLGNGVCQFQNFYFPYLLVSQESEHTCSTQNYSLGKLISDKALLFLTTQHSKGIY